MTTEAVEGVVVREERDEEPDRRLAVVGERQQSVQIGLGSVMALSDEQFEANLALLQKGVQRAKRLQQALLEPGTDYGTVPGISRPFLHKPGAEKFEKAYGFAIEYAVERKVGDGQKTPELEYIVHAKVHLGDTDGPVIAEGLGSCNTHETKYRYRQAQAKCPDCGKDTIIKGREDGKLHGKWWCNTHKGGCGHAFDKEDVRLTEQVVGQVENENPHDLANTILKMARKRAGVDAILTATGTSGLFTQDPDSPSVERDASAGDSGSAATAAAGGEAAGQGASSLRGPNTATKLPPAGKFEDGTPVKSLGVGELIGTGKVVPDKQRSDGNLRQSADGHFLGFRLVMPSGQEIAQVEVRDALAEELSLRVVHNPTRLDGLEMLLAGELFACTWSKEGETMPPFYRLAVTGVRTTDWTLPAGAAPAAEPKPAKRLTKAQQKAADDAAAAAANDDTDDPNPAEPDGGATSYNEAAAAKTSGPAMTLDAFNEAAKPFRLAKAYVEQACKSQFSTTDIAAITDQQRHVLATGLGLFEAP
jgi:hypothetical protein